MNSGRVFQIGSLMVSESLNSWIPYQTEKKKRSILSPLPLRFRLVSVFSSLSTGSLVLCQKPSPLLFTFIPPNDRSLTPLVVQVSVRLVLRLILLRLYVHVPLFLSNKDPLSCSLFKDLFVNSSYNFLSMIKFAPFTLFLVRTISVPY